MRGPEYEDVLVDSFLEKLDAQITARIRAEVGSASHGSSSDAKEERQHSTGVVLGSLGIGIPLTGIAAGTAGTPGLFLAWGGIVAVNVAYALSRRSRR